MTVLQVWGEYAGTSFLFKMKLAAGQLGSPGHFTSASLIIQGKPLLKIYEFFAE